MTNGHKGSLHPVLFGIVATLTSVLVVTIRGSAIPPSFGTGSGQHCGEAILEDY